MNFKSKYYKTAKDYEKEMPFLKDEDVDLSSFEVCEDAMFAFYIGLFY